jgi:hypothetical protein
VDEDYGIVNNRKDWTWLNKDSVEELVKPVQEFPLKRT